MKLVIFAGGFGSRLSEETRKKPKPMVNIGGMPIIWHIMKYYSCYGITEFIICGGYKYNIIKKFFNKKSIKKINKSWKIKIVNTGLKTQTGGRLKKIKKNFKKNEIFCLTYGDGLSNVNILKMIKFHKKNKKLITLLAVRPPARFGSLKIKKNLVIKFNEKPYASEGWINGGFFVCSSKCINYIKNRNTIWERSPLENIAKNKQLIAYKHNKFWACMDTLRDKNQLVKLWKSKKSPWKIW